MIYYWAACAKTHRPIRRFVHRRKPDESWITVAHTFGDQAKIEAYDADGNHLLVIAIPREHKVFVPSQGLGPGMNTVPVDLVVVSRAGGT